MSIVVPAYNESERLPATLDRLLSYLAEHGPASTEIVVVDDGSKDNTADLVIGYSRQHPQIRLVRNPGNRGKGFAVRNGMLEACGEWILFTDADLSSPIEEWTRLEQATRTQNTAIAIGSRAIDRSLIKVRQPLAREIAGRTFNLMLRWILHLPYFDTQCGFKLYRRDAAQKVFRRQLLDGFSFDVEDLVIARRLGLIAAEVPVTWNNVGGTKVTLMNGLRSYADVFRIWWNDRRGLYRNERANP